MMRMMMIILIRKEANEVCSKFGSDVFMAGEINSKEDFDVYYEVALITIVMRMLMNDHHSWRGEMLWCEVLFQDW